MGREAVAPFSAGKLSDGQVVGSLIEHGVRCSRGAWLMKKLRFTLGALALLAAGPSVAAPQGDEPVAVSAGVRQGIDFIYVDPDLANVSRHQRPQNWLDRMFSGSAGQSGGPSRMFADLARGLQQYRASWGRLPQVKLPAGPTLKRGMTGKRVALLRTRLGLSPGGAYDDQLGRVVADYQRVHGLGSGDGIAGSATIASLNRGSEYYARRIAINMERAYRLPAIGSYDRYVVVDSGAAETYLINRDRVADSMRVVIGSVKTKTPMMAVILRSARANPYWNVPPELIRSLTAARIKQQGLTYLRDFHYEVLSDWTVNARPIDPASVNWAAIASGRKAPTILVRQLPGPWNSMGAMKFEMPNDYGIYLHDTPHKELFAQTDRWVSNGCVRLEDYQRFADWVFGRPPEVTSPLEQRFVLERPIPVFMTYLTVAPSRDGVTFRPDPYGFDTQAMAQMFGGGRGA